MMMDGSHYMMQPRVATSLSLKSLSKKGMHKSMRELTMGTRYWDGPDNITDTT